MTVFCRPALCTLIACLFIVSSHILAVSSKQSRWEATNFCKCICFGSNYTILKLDVADTPSKPCLSCTKQWCLNQDLEICAGATIGDIDPDTATGKEGDVEARCFQRDSPRDQLVVTLYLLIVFGLLLGAGVKGRMLKAGFNTSLPSWSTRRKWWEEWVPLRQNRDVDLGEQRTGDYISLSNSHE